MYSVSGQESPSPQKSVCARARCEIPEVIASLSGGHVVNRPISSQAVCDGVDGPQPARQGSLYVSRLSPHPPSAFLTRFIQLVVEDTMA